MRWLPAALLALFALPAMAHEGWGLVVHDRLGVVFADIPGNTIWRVANGRAEPVLRDVHSHALVALPDGSIYGTDAKLDGSRVAVWRLGPDGRVTEIVRDAPFGGQSFLITADGTMYSANRYDHRRPSVVLLRRNPDGSIEPIADRFTAIDGMAATSDRRIVVADGASLHVVGGSATRLTARRWGEDLLGVSVRGNIVHVADHAGRRILRVDLNTGAASTADRSSFLWAPAGVEAAADTLYVLEHLRPPPALLGDLQIGPYLRVRRSDTTIAIVWGRHTRIAAAFAAAMLLAVALLIRRLRR